MISKQSFLGAAIGTMIEYYDYAIFGLFLPLFSPVFFPAETHYESLVQGYIVFCISMIARPLGGIFFGTIGDRQGRKKALMLSIYGIAGASLVIGFIPSYHSIGFLAPLLILLCRSVQTFCFGGEYNGAGIYVVEHSKGRKEATWGSLLTATTLCGSLIATAIGIVLTLPFMPDWSWRIAFILGGVLATWGVFYRKKMLESPNFKPTNINQHRFLTLIKKHPRQLFAGFCIGGMATVPFTTVLTFINPVMTTQGIITEHELMILQTVLILVAMATLITAGRLADRFSPRKIMSIGAIALAVFSPFALHGLATMNLAWIILGEIALLIMNELLLGPASAYLKNCFDGPYRYRAASFSFTLGMSVLGGLTPLIENALFKSTSHFSSISIWLAFVGVLTLVSIVFNKTPEAKYQARVLCPDAPHAQTKDPLD